MGHRQGADRGELAKAAASTGATKTKATNEANRLRIAFMERLTAFRVLDPACGSGNFLYLALLELKNLEHRVNLESEALACPANSPASAPRPCWASNSTLMRPNSPGSRFGSARSSGCAAATGLRPPATRSCAA